MSTHVRSSIYFCYSSACIPLPLYIPLVEDKAGVSSGQQRMGIPEVSSNDFFFLGAQWLSGRVLDSRPRGRRFEPHRCHCVVVLEQDTLILAEYWFNPGRPYVKLKDC